MGSCPDTDIDPIKLLRARYQDADRLKNALGDRMTSQDPLLFRP